MSQVVLGSSQKVLLLRGDSPQMAGIEVFLRGRGYTVIVVLTLAEAVQFITHEKPDYALLPTELVPSRSAWLFGILGQLTGVILYASRFSAKTLLITRELKGIYLLEPPLDPTGVEQMLRRVQRDHQKQTDEASRLNHANVVIMSTLAELALNKVCVPGRNGVGAETVRQVNRVSCYHVRTKLISGYFVLAYGQSRSLDPSWSARLQAELRSYIASIDEEPTLDSLHDIAIEEVEFNRWTKEQADFMRSTTHEEAELVVAFFKDKTELSAQDSAKVDFSEVSLDHFQGDTKVDFEVYIYLPQNARFILYTPSGGTLYASQKNKLMAEGINSVHIPKRSLDIVRRNRANNFLAERTADFRQN